LWLADFPIIWFSIFIKNTGGFLEFVSDVVFGFSYLGSGLSSILAPPLILKSHETQKLLGQMHMLLLSPLYQID